MTRLVKKPTSDLVNQPTSEATRKVKAGALSAAGVAVPGAVIVGMLTRWFGLDVTPEEAFVIGTLAGSAISAVASWVGGYLTRERDAPGVSGT